MFKFKNMLMGVCLLLLLASCAAPESGAAVATGQAGGLSADFADAMPVVSQLAAGTIVLESGDLAVTDEQAAQLLPLWQAYSSLVADGGTAEAELNGLASQIQNTMTDEQIAEIAGLQLTQAKLQEMIEAGDIQMGRGQGRGQGRGEQGRDGGGQQGGQGQGGGGGGRGQGGLGGGQGGQGGGGVGQLSPDDIATRQAERIEAAGGEDAFFTAQVTGAVVRLLNVKVNGEMMQQQGQNPFTLANETVASALDMSTDDLLAAAEGDTQSIQQVVEESGGDVEEIRAALTEALADTRASQNGDLDGFIDNYLAGSGIGRGGRQGEGE